VSAEDEVRAAAAALVADFGAGRVEAYFGHLAPDATFVFHASPQRLGSRAAYREEWARWEREDGFRVLACASANGQVQVLSDDVAVFTHDVRTRVAAAGAQEELVERESVVWQRRDGRWLVVHEHLSVPTGS
jgi:ketosteroid isomerase-like protein